MTNNTIEFSLIIANYNNAKFLGDCIKSVLSQTCTKWEAIIYDDGSTDNSLDVIEPYLTDKRIRLIKGEKNNGYVFALKKMIDNVGTDIVGILDSDDALAADAIEIMLLAHKNNKNRGLIYSQFTYCNQNLKPIRIGRCKKIEKGGSELLNNYISAFRTFKKKDYNKTSGFDIKMLYAEDKDLYYKMEEVTKPLFIDKSLYYYRYVESSQSHDKKKNFIGMNCDLIAKHNAYKRRLLLSIPNFTKREISLMLMDFFIVNIKALNIKYACIFLKKFFEPKTFRFKSLVVLFLRVFKINILKKNG